MSTEMPNTGESNEPTDDATQSEESDGKRADGIEVKPWEDIGRRLLRARLERAAEETVRDAFRQATSRIADGDELTEDDIREMYDAIQEAKRATELAAETSPETGPFPDLWEFLCDEDRQAYVEEVEQRRDL